jgi:DNA-binding MarR family transcriptional regulator
MSSQNRRQKAEYRAEICQQLMQLGEIGSTETALFHQTAASTIGMGITDLKAMSILLQEGSATPGRLSARLGLTSGAMTAVIDRLERRQYAKRQADHSDRRKVTVAINKEKLPEMNKAYASMGNAFMSLLQKYSTEELEFLVRFHKDSIELTKQEIARLIGK